MDLAKKILHSCFLLCFIAFLASCENRCYEIEEFDSHFITLNSYPPENDVSGTYDAVTGGQHALWNDAKGLQSDGTPFVIQISGAWSPWNRKEVNSQILRDMDSCLDINKMCAKKSDGSSSNCICYDGQVPEAEYDKICTSDDYDNPILCTCDPDGGDATDYDTYHFPINYYTKDEVMVNPDRQVMCKYDRGMGAYIGLFGPRGVTEPVRLYHLYSQGETVCTVGLKDGKCIDDEGNDKTAYIFRSRNDETGEPSIFMKDDHDGNNGNNDDTSNDEYHVAGEAIKLKIFDRYYSDNKGNYNITILSGAGYGSASGYNGILEFLVAIVEDTLMGEMNDNGEREGGIIEYMYKSITQDSGFILFVQGMLVMYVTVFGMAIIMGVVEIKRSEMISRIVKVSLILLFTSSNSWAIYNQIVVGFFYDSMNYVVSLMTSLSNCALDTQTTTQLINSGYKSAACLTNNDGTVFSTPAAMSESSRFGYIDLLIMTFLSEAVAAKVFALLIPTKSLGFIFGLIYVPVIFALIAAFVYIMLTAAVMYAMNLMKIIFVLALGPIFMCFTLFSQTNQMFKNWLSFLGARSLENIIIFAILFNFVMILNTHFIEMLSYKACVENIKIGLISLPILQAHVNRDLLEWMLYFCTIGGLLYMTYAILQQIPNLAGGLISIGGVANQGSEGQASLKFAHKSVAQAFGAAMKGSSLLGSGVTRGAGEARKSLGYMADKTGFSSAMSKAGDKMNLRGRLPEFVSNRIPTMGLGVRTVNAEINVAREAAKAAGRTGKDANDYIRENATARLMDRSLKKNPLDRNTRNRDPQKFAMMGITPGFIANQMDKQLKKEPLKELMASKAKELRADKATAAMTEKEMRQKLREIGSNYLQQDHGMSKREADNYVSKRSPSEHKTAFEQDLQSIIKKSSQLTSAQAARMTAENPEMKDQFMQNFKGKEAKENYKSEKAWQKNQRSTSESTNPFGKAAIMMGNAANKANATRKGVIDSIGRAGRNATGTSAADARKRYERELSRETSDSIKHSLNPLNYSARLREGADYISSSVLGRDISGGATAMAEKANRAALLKSLQSDPQENIEKKYGFQKQADALALEGKKLKLKEERQINADKEKANAKENSARTLFQKQLNESAAKDLKPDLRTINDHKKNLDKATSPEIQEMQQDLFKKIKGELLSDDGKGNVKFNDRKTVKDADGNDQTVANNESLFERVGKLDSLHKAFGNEPLNLQEALTQDFKDVVAEGVEQTRKDAANLEMNDPDYDKKKESIDKDVEQLQSMKVGLFNGDTSKIDDTSNHDYYAQIAERFSRRMENNDISKIARDIAKNSAELEDTSNDSATTNRRNDDHLHNDVALSNQPDKEDASKQLDQDEGNREIINDLHEENRTTIASLDGLYDENKEKLLERESEIENTVSPERARLATEKEQNDFKEMSSDTVSITSENDKGGTERSLDIPEEEQHDLTSPRELPKTTNEFVTPDLALPLDLKSDEDTTKVKDLGDTERSDLTVAREFPKESLEENLEQDQTSDVQTSDLENDVEDKALDVTVSNQALPAEENHIEKENADLIHDASSRITLDASDKSENEMEDLRVDKYQVPAPETKQNHQMAKYQEYPSSREEIQAIADLFNNGNLQEYADKAKDYLDVINDDQSTLEQVEAAVKEIDNIQEELNSNNKATGLIGNDVKIEFGASISDILLNAADVGIKGMDFSQIFLGVQGAGSGMDHALYASLVIDKSQAEGKLKMTKVKLKTKAFELEKKKAELSEMQKSGGDVTSINTSISGLESEVNSLQNDFDSGKRGVETISNNLDIVERNK